MVIPRNKSKESNRCFGKDSVISCSNQDKYSLLHNNINNQLSSTIYLLLMIKIGYNKGYLVWYKIMCCSLEVTYEKNNWYQFHGSLGIIIIFRRKQPQR